MLSERKNLMEKTRERISEELSGLKSQTGLHLQLNRTVFELLNKRVEGHLGVRSYFVHALSRYIQRQAELEGLPMKRRPQDLFDTQLPLLAEGIITVQYLENQILDGKDQTRSCEKEAPKQRRDQKLLASHYVKDFLYDYIDNKILPDDLEDKRLVARTVRRIFRYVDLGQMMQDEWGTYDWFKQGHKGDISISPEIDAFLNKPIIRLHWKKIGSKGINSRHVNFMRNYLRRIYLTSGALFVMLAELEMDLLGYEGKERNNIINAAASIGIIGQMVNDICDFVPHPTVAKEAEDVFSDIRNDIVTLPLALYFDRNPNKEIKDLKELAKSAFQAFAETKFQKIPGTKLFLGMKPALLSSMEIVKELRECSRIFFDESLPEGILLEDMNSVVDKRENRILRFWVPQLEALTPPKMSAERKPQPKPVAA